MSIHLAVAVPIADMGPGPILGPAALGSSAVAGVFLAAAVVTGGLWLHRRSQARPAGMSRKACLLSLGAAGILGASFPLLLGLFFAPFLLVAGVVFVAGIFFLIKGLAARREDEIENAQEEAAIPPEE